MAKNWSRKAKRGKNKRENGKRDKNGLKDANVSRKVKNCNDVSRNGEKLLKVVEIG